MATSWAQMSRFGLKFGIDIQIFSITAHKCYGRGDNQFDMLVRIFHIHQNTYTYIWGQNKKIQLKKLRNAMKWETIIVYRGVRADISHPAEHIYNSNNI